MTQQGLAKQMYDVVDNGNFMNESPKTMVEKIEALLDTLVPKNKETFAKWGQPNEQSTIEKCWLK